MKTYRHVCLAFSLATIMISPTLTFGAHEPLQLQLSAPTIEGRIVAKGVLVWESRLSSQPHDVHLKREYVVLQIAHALQ